jgi:hypothetical protein
MADGQTPSPHYLSMRSQTSDHYWRLDMTMREEIKSLENKLTGLHNDARYHDLRRTYGEYSIKVLRHLRGIEGVQARGENHT